MLGELLKGAGKPPRAPLILRVTKGRLLRRDDSKEIRFRGTSGNEFIFEKDMVVIGHEDGENDLFISRGVPGAERIKHSHCEIHHSLGKWAVSDGDDDGAKVALKRKSCEGIKLIDMDVMKGDEIHLPAEKPLIILQIMNQDEEGIQPGTIRMTKGSWYRQDILHRSAIGAKLAGKSMAQESTFRTAVKKAKEETDDPEERRKKVKKDIEANQDLRLGDFRRIQKLSHIRNAVEMIELNRIRPKKRKLTVGRSAECDIILDSEKVPERACEIHISWWSGGWTVKALTDKIEINPREATIGGLKVPKGKSFPLFIGNVINVNEGALLVLE